MQNITFPLIAMSGVVGRMAFQASIEIISLTCVLRCLVLKWWRKLNFPEKTVGFLQIMNT